MLLHLLPSLNTITDLINVACCSRELWNLIIRDSSSEECRYRRDFKPDYEENKALAVKRLLCTPEQLAAAANVDFAALESPTRDLALLGLPDPFASKNRDSMRSFSSLAESARNAVPDPESWLQLYRRRAIQGEAWCGGDLRGQWAPSVFGESIQDVLYLDMRDAIHEQQGHIVRRALVQRVDGKGFLLLESRAPRDNEPIRPTSRRGLTTLPRCWRWTKIRDLPWKGWQAGENVKFDYRGSVGIINEQYAVITTRCLKPGSSIDWTWCLLAWRIRDGRLLQATTHLADPAHLELDGRLLLHTEKQRNTEPVAVLHDLETMSRDALKSMPLLWASTHNTTHLPFASLAQPLATLHDKSVGVFEHWFSGAYFHWRLVSSCGEMAVREIASGKCRGTKNVVALRSHCVDDTLTLVEGRFEDDDGGSYLALFHYPRNALYGSVLKQAPIYRVSRWIPIEENMMQPACRLLGSLCFVGFSWREQHAIILDAATGQIYYHQFPIPTVAHGPNFIAIQGQLCYYSYAGLLMTEPNCPV
ncbi:hypothetical protein BDF19DRAFT_426191 [Syncephalis fuscata]|nr:hypothetical protein BDF19DRAFT_426191 [Syncephalis fuscata]